jgi:hypothetical protein
MDLMNNRPGNDTWRPSGSIQALTWAKKLNFINSRWEKAQIPNLPGH